MIYIYHYDVAAFFISLVILFNLYIKQRIQTRVTNAFRNLTVCLLISIISDLITIFSISYYYVVPIWLNYILNIICLLSYNSLPVFFLISIYTATMDENEKISKKANTFLFLPILLVYLLILTTPFTKAIIYFSEDGKYHCGSLFNVLTCIGFIYLILVVIRGIQKRKNIRFEQTVTIIVYSVSTITALAISYIFPSLLVPLFFASLSVLLTYLSLDNPSEYLDPVMDIYNKKAFMFTSVSRFKRKRKFSILGIQIDGISYLNETIGYTNFNNLLIQLSKKLTGICGKQRVFRLSGSKLAIILDSDDRELDDKLLEVQLLFSQPLKISNIEISFKYKMTIIHCPDDGDNFTKINDLIFNTLDSPETEYGKIVNGSTKLLEKTKREYQLLQILKKAIAEDGFEIFYQPIFSVEEQRYTTAEALIRLSNTEFGFISPEEFIPLAERNGLILQIGDFVFNSVCKFITTNKIWEKGIEYVHVNLSVIQCMQERLHEKLCNIMDFYNLEYNRIQLEVTETSAAISSDTLFKNMKQLNEKNINFALDDYGMGFSNTSAILKYPFQTVKLDKSIVWSAIDDEKAEKLIHHTISMFKDMGIVTIAEGVETQEMINMLTKMKCDYFQGFFFSKPVCEKDFLTLISQ